MSCVLFSPPKIEKDIAVRVPSFDRQVIIPYGYQNGRFQLVRPARFEAKDPERIESTACRYAIEGESLYKNRDDVLGDLQLVVVGQFASKKSKSRDVVRGIFVDHGVRLFASDQVDELIDDIRVNGKERPNRQ